MPAVDADRVRQLHAVADNAFVEIRLVQDGIELDAASEPVRAGSTKLGLDTPSALRSYVSVNPARPLAPNSVTASRPHHLLAHARVAARSTFFAFAVRDTEPRAAARSARSPHDVEDVVVNAVPSRGVRPGSPSGARWVSSCPEYTARFLCVPVASSARAASRTGDGTA